MNTETRKLNLAFVLTVIAAYVPTLVSSEGLTPRAVLVMVGLGAVYTWLGLQGASWFERSGRRTAMLLYFALQIALVTILVQTSPEVGTLWLLPFPLVAQSVVALPRRWVVVVCGLIAFVFVGPVGVALGWLEAGLVGLNFLAGIVFVAIFTQVYVSEVAARTEVQRLAAELAQANQKLREHAVQVEELATTQERNRLAREIHDTVGHFLTVIHMQLEAARAVFETQPDQAFGALQKAQSLTKDGLAEIRRSVAALRAPATDGRPLPDVVEALLAECRAAGLVAELVVCGLPRRLPPQVEHTLFRTAQEGLTNVRKHARASRVAVTLDYESQAQVRLVIEDNGVGADVDVLRTGFGLLGLRERVQLLGGQIRLDTDKRQGFRLEVDVPV